MTSLQSLTQTKSIRQANVDIWVAPHRLRCKSAYTGRLFACNCLLQTKAVRWSEPALVPFIYPYAQGMVTCFLRSKTMVLDKLIIQNWWFLPMHHMGCIVTIWHNLYTGRLLSCNCLLTNEAVRWCDPAFVPIFKLHVFSPNLAVNQWCWRNKCWCLRCTTWIALS